MVGSVNELVSGQGQEVDEDVGEDERFNQVSRLVKAADRKGLVTNGFGDTLELLLGDGLDEGCVDENSVRGHHVVVQPLPELGS